LKGPFLEPCWRCTIGRLVDSSPDLSAQKDH
jgi:hypothetical protein